MQWNRGQTTVVLKGDLDKCEAERFALAEPAVAKALDNGPPKQVIVVPKWGFHVVA